MAQVGFRVAINSERYPVEPSKNWAKMKELRRMYFRRTWDAYDRGAPVIQGLFEACHGYLHGIGEFVQRSWGPFFALQRRNLDENLKSLEAVEAYGFTNDLCSSMRLHMGQMLRGLSTLGPQGQEGVVPTINFKPSPCHSEAKMGQFFSEYMGVPYLPIEVPFWVDAWDASEKDSQVSQHRLLPELRQYLIEQLEEGIGFLEKHTGRKYDDERAIEHVKNEWQSRALRAKIDEELKHIPAPWDRRQLGDLESVGHDTERESVEYFRELLDETRDRVRRGISARGWEKLRLTFEGITPGHSPETMRMPNYYGAVVLMNCSGVGGPLRRTYRDGHVEPVGSLEEEGREIRTRQDMLEAIVDMDVDFAQQGFTACHISPERSVALARDWKCQGVIMHKNRGCNSEATGQLETLLALERAGYAICAFEGSQSDPRDFNEAAVKDALAAFFESFGLSRLKPEEIMPDIENVHAARSDLPASVSGSGH